MDIVTLWATLLTAALGALSLGAGAQAEGRVRVRALGLAPGMLPTGPLNAITDVAGVRVGHTTIVRGDGPHALRTGVTAILPHEGNLFQEKVPAAVYVGNGFGKAAGFLQVQELGLLETPIVLTNTLSVGTAVEAVVRWTLKQQGNQAVRSVNAVVGEVNDGLLSDIRAQAVTGEDVVAAIESARSGPVEEGCVGGGTGAVCFGFKGGVGTASRALPPSLGGWTVGALVQANFGGALTMDGLRVGEALGRYAFRQALERQKSSQAGPPQESPDGSCMIVLATDAPLSARQLQRLARRAVLGLARTGSFMSNGSGDFVIAFSTARRVAHHSDASVETVELLRDDRLSPLFLAAVESVEEAVYNALCMATTTTGRDGVVVEALPLEKVRAMVRKRRSD